MWMDGELADRRSVVPFDDAIALAPSGEATQHNRIRLISCVALMAIAANVITVPEQPIEGPRDQPELPTESPKSTESPQSLGKQSFLSFAVHHIEDVAVNVSQRVQTTIWPESPTGGAWLALPVQPGWQADRLFAAHTKSLVAKAVGSAEGTRRPDGAKNQAYYGHVDPGNAVWNVGTFSYQHCGRCAPEEADRRQLARLAGQFAQIQAQAQGRYGLQLSLEEQLNAIDLANQAPLAALSEGGFVDRLQAAKQQGLQGSDAILQARVYAYKNPRTQRWEAPGLGNTKASITHDQARRQAAIAEAIRQHGR
ncbi:MAG: hypothetical protein RLZZ511_2548 [Cyanobacteriota bacterium]|jgi:hypothetical protein